MPFPGLRPLDTRPRRDRRQDEPGARDPDVPVVDEEGRVAPAPSAQGPFPGLQPSGARPRTAGERAEALGGGIRRGAQTGLPFAAGLTAGAAAFPVTGPVGAFAAGTAGFEAARHATKRMADNVPEIHEIAPELRPYAFAGEVLGAGGPAGASPVAFMGATRQIGQRAAPVIEEAGGNIFQRIVQFGRRQAREVGRTARERPGTMLAAEGTAVASAAAGAAGAEALRPGEDRVRITSEIAMGLISPTALFVSGSSAAADSARNLIRSRSQAGLEAGAAAELGRVYSELGLDPQQAARTLRREIRPDDPRTAAQIVDDPALQAIQATLIGRSAQFGKAVRDSAEESLERYRQTLASLEATGDPALLREAAVVRKRYFDDLLEGLVSDAQRRAVDVGRRMAPEPGTDTARLSARADTIVNESLQKARAAERELYSRVPGGTRVPGENTLARIADVKRNDMLPGESLPPVVTEFARALRQSGMETEARIVDAAGRPLAEAGTPGTTLDRLQLFRTRMLERSREADANFNAAEARRFGMLAEAALDDMLSLDIPELDAARAFSRSLNDVFTRSFAGQAVSTGRGGTERLPPEALLRRAVSGGKELGSLRMQELQRAVQFGDPEAATELLSMQEQFLRHAAQETIDPDTGLVSAARLATFRRNNSQILEQFPGLRDDLSELSSARRLLNETTATAQTAQRAIDQRAAFSRVAGAENTTALVGRMLTGERPQENIRQLAALAKRDGPDAVDGLRRAVFDDAYVRAGGDADTFSFSRFDRVLHQPRRAGQPSTMQLLERNGVIDAEQKRNLRRILTEAERVEQSMVTQGGVDALLEGDNAVTDLVLRFTGAGLGAGASRASGSPTPSLVAAGAGSRFMRQVFDRIPRGKQQDVLIEAMQNPRFAAALLERAPEPAQRIAVARRIHGYLWAAGLVETQEALEGLTEQAGEP